MGLCLNNVASCWRYGNSEFTLQDLAVGQLLDIFLTQTQILQKTMMAGLVVNSGEAPLYLHLVKKMVYGIGLVVILV